MPSATTCKSGAKRKRQLIAIAGPSGAGKTTLARALAHALPAPTGILPLDAYYCDRSALPPAARARCNFDAPAALDEDLLCEHIGALAEGRSIEMPIYDFASHSSQAQTLRLAATEYVVIEGLFALYFPALLPLYCLRIFVDLADELCLQRRIVRDAAERGRSARDIRRQYDEQVRPMYMRYIHPTRQNAQYIIAGNGEFTAQIQVLLSELGCSK